MPTILVIVLGAFLATACYKPPETVALTEDSVLLDNRMIRPVHEESKLLGVWTHGRSALNSHYAHALNSAGIEDPSPQIETALVRHLTDRTGAAGTGTTLTFGPDKPNNLVGWAQSHAVTDPIVDVETKYWGLEWWSSSFRYEAAFRLVDPISGRTVAQYRCEMKSPEVNNGVGTSRNPFPNDESSRALFIENAAPIKAIVNELAAACAEEIKTMVL